jgi:hypothetical protein
MVSTKSTATTFMEWIGLAFALHRIVEPAARLGRCRGRHVTAAAD